VCVCVCLYEPIKTLWVSFHSWADDLSTQYSPTIEKCPIGRKLIRIETLIWHANYFIICRLRTCIIHVGTSCKYKYARKFVCRFIMKLIGRYLLNTYTLHYYYAHCMRFFCSKKMLVHNNISSVNYMGIYLFFCLKLEKKK